MKQNIKLTLTHVTQTTSWFLSLSVVFCILLLTGCKGKTDKQAEESNEFFEDLQVPQKPSGDLVTETPDNGLSSILMISYPYDKPVFDFNYWEAQYYTKDSEKQYYVADNHVQVWDKDCKVILAEYDYINADSSYGQEYKSFKIYSQLITKYQQEPNHLCVAFDGLCYYEDGPADGEAGITEGTICYYANGENGTYLMRKEQYTLNESFYKDLDAKMHEIEVKTFDSNNAVVNHIFSQKIVWRFLLKHFFITKYYDANDALQYYTIDETTDLKEEDGCPIEYYKITKYDKYHQIISVKKDVIGHGD